MKEKVNDLEDTLQSHLVLFERETSLKAAAKRWRFLGGVGEGSVVLYKIWRDLCKSFLFSGKLAQHSPILYNFQILLIIVRAREMKWWFSNGILPLKCPYFSKLAWRLVNWRHIAIHLNWAQINLFSE